MSLHRNLFLLFLFQTNKSVVIVVPSHLDIGFHKSAKTTKTMPNQRAANKAPLNIFVDKDLKEKFKDLAERRETGLTQLINDLLSQELVREEKAQIAQARKKAGKAGEGGRKGRA